MKNRLLVILSMFFALFFAGNSLAYNNRSYPYKVSSGCVDCCYKDRYNFCKNNCTSYVAHVLNVEYGISFHNKYRGFRWGHGGKWVNAAEKIGIAVDKNPLPGDAAYIKGSNENKHGHILHIEKVHYEGKSENGDPKPVAVDLTEYNNNKACGFGERKKVPISEFDGFIHILAYEEGLNGTYYADCHELGETLCPFDQTEEEWAFILRKVREDYRCKENCDFIADCPLDADCFVDGSTRHIIHRNYRCSNDQCWEPGGDTNCWDANKWYEIKNGDINDIIRYRKSEMCAEVYEVNPGGGGGFYPSGPIPQPLPGPRSDIRVDFDVFDEKGKEVSANHGKPSKPVYSGQKVKTSLEMMVENRDVKDSLRESSTDHIRGKIWWRIAGKTQWQEWVSEKYDVDDLGKNDSPTEYDWKTIPHYPGEVLELKACGDTSDRIHEPNEGGDRKVINNPDQSGTTNNCSRTERFYVNHPFGYLDGVNQEELWGWARNPNSTKYVDVHIYVDGPGTPENFLGGTTAIEPRNDLPYPDKNHGFRFKIPNTLRDNKSHTFYVYAINPDGENPPLKNSPRTQKIANQMPGGAIYGNGCKIEGWAKDPDTNGPATIHFYIDAPVEEGGEFIGSATTYNDQYQFISTVPAKYRREPHKIWGYVIDNYNMGHIMLQGSPYQTDCMKILIPLLFN